MDSQDSDTAFDQTIVVSDATGSSSAERKYTFANRFQSSRTLGQGGMGTVRAAFDEYLERAVAIKSVLDIEGKQFQDALIGEASTIANINHPNVIQIFDIQPVEKGIHLIMELAEHSVHDLMKREQDVLVEQTVMQYAYQAASALYAVHKKKVLHRDVKPQNMLLLQNNAVLKLTDFGLAAPIDSTKDAKKKANTCGTAGYIAPETLRGEQSDNASDIYGLGCSLYAMLTGNRPYNDLISKSNNLAPYIKAVGKDHVPPKDISTLVAISSSGAELIRKMMAEDPAHRIQTAKKALEWLKPYVNVR